MKQKKKKKKKKQIQERALRIVFCDYQPPYKELLEKAGVSTLYVDRLRAAMCEVYKVFKDIGPAYLKKYFTIQDSFYETRTAMPLVLPKFRSIRYGIRSFRYEGALLWSNLNKRSKDLSVLLDSCSWDDIGNFLQTCIKNSLLQTKSVEIWENSHTVPHYACINFKSYSTP